MRHTPTFVLSDVDEVRRLVRENPWATIVASTADGIVASHYPVVLEDDPADPDAIVLVTSAPGRRRHQSDYVFVDWGPAFQADHAAAFPHSPTPTGLGASRGETVRRVVFSLRGFHPAPLGGEGGGVVENQAAGHLQFG